ncbi:MAG: tRNA uridine-5-carboxymethylaminomethyl(34) synthesis enzyme MnmG [Deltaproteobacteria bacterium]|nr:tRNA uridine-5-carboxymethylaminomethyl(34) synthesis enzyme MnmG [Deltaproteobacteria bacterium]
MPGTGIGSRLAEVLVVGGGHAGCEAALAAARLGKDTLLVTGALDRIAAMSCNPAIGGVGKGHLVKELDALGGEMARAADDTGIHFRILNESRGPAVRATRCQSDLERYRAEMARVVQGAPGLRVRQDDVVALLVVDGRIGGVRTAGGEELRARRVVLTTGTFLGGVLHRGAERWPGGRTGESPAAGLSTSLAAHGVLLGRLKTGTCPRLDARTVDVASLPEQRPDEPAPRFSVDSGPPPLPQVSCRLTRTTARTHGVIRAAANDGRAPLFNGQIGGRGPRYCPSIEDKVVRFADKDSHLIFLEPHGLDSHELYPNGLSTSLPVDVQLAFLRTIPGLEHVEVTRWGYAVEYDYVLPTQLSAALELRALPGLFCAGQINGTTGYEEAAVQGLLAGINAVRSLDGLDPIVLRRDQAYAGVLVDDLVLLGTEEPYRMFTSRAEHRLLLREDNVGARLLELSDSLGLASATRRARMRGFEDAVRARLRELTETRVEPSVANVLLQRVDGTPLKEATTLLQLFRRPEVDVPLLWELHGTIGDIRVDERVKVELSYQGYIERAHRDLARDRALDDALLPDAIFAAPPPGLSHEVREKLVRLRPRTLGAASRISGVTPAALGLLAVELRRIAASAP